ncbi:hypothetical protein GCM10022268_06980 [Sphingomonas cynarae]|uniref:Peptidoglycan-binding protein n=1 Tax=Sphingomonas cynarae TaxID=930197 RepID=A0ABP7D158_9SPHN
MIDRLALQSLPPAQRARLIYGEVQADMSRRLWQAALGNGDGAADGDTVTRAQLPGAAEERSSLDTLLALLKPDAPATPIAPRAIAEPRVAEARIAQPSHDDAPVAGLGPNARYAGVIDAAAERTGLSPAALAAIVDAEAGRSADGSWQTWSRNPRSSAAGLGQFLAGTWQGMAEIPGTWLNQQARGNGWLDAHGKVAAGARSALLALRYDPAASINSVADYARRNIDGLARAGVTDRDTGGNTAQLAYLGHHLGLGDAIRFMRGGLPESRARVLLNAQVGTAGSERRIEAAGGARAAHRSWLMGYLDRKFSPERFG